MLVAGPDIDASGGWERRGRARRAAATCPSGRSPRPAAAGSASRRATPTSSGILPPAIGPIAETLAGHDLILVAGASVFAYYPYVPGDLLPEGAELVVITSDPDEAARAPMGEAIVADVALTLDALLAELGDAESDRAGSRAARGPMDPADLGVEPATPISGTEAMAALGSAFPDDGIIVLEAPSATLALRNQLRISRPGSYYFGAGGGLGFGLAAAVGVQIAQPDRPVVCVVGEGSAQYAITAFWSAAAYDVPVTFLVLRNSEYAILKWFSLAEGVEGAPGLDLPALDVAAVAAGYGVPAREVESGEELSAAARSSDRLRQARRSSRSASPRACGWSRAGRSMPMPLLTPKTARIAPAPPAAPPADRAAPEVADGTASRLAAELRADRRRSGSSAAASDLIRYASDASPYRRIPAAVVQPRTASQVAGLMACRSRSGTPLVFRAGGTSLNGQSQTDGILVDVRRHWGGIEVLDDGAPRPGRARHRARPRQPGPRALRPPARPRPGLDRHRHRRRRRRQQLRRHALRDRRPTPTDGQRADVRAAVGDGDRHRGARRRRALRRRRARARRRA